MTDNIDTPVDKAEDNSIIPTLGQLRIAWKNEDYDEYYQILIQIWEILEFLHQKGEKLVAGKSAVFNSRLDKLWIDYDTHQRVNQELLIQYSLSPYNLNSLFVWPSVDDVINKHRDELVSLSTIREDAHMLPWDAIVAMVEWRFVNIPTSDKWGNSIKH